MCSFVSAHSLLEEWIICKFKRGGIPNITGYTHTLSLYEARQFHFYGPDDNLNDNIADIPVQVCVTFTYGTPSVVCPLCGTSRHLTFACRQIAKLLLACS